MQCGWFVGLSVVVSALVGVTAVTAPPDKPKVRIDVSPCMALAPTDVKIRVWVGRDERNRGFEAEVHDGDFTLRSRFTQLDGEKSPQNHEWMWRMVTGGELTFDVHLKNQFGTWVTAEKKCVLIPVGEPVEDPNPPAETLSVRW